MEEIDDGILPEIDAIALFANPAQRRRLEEICEREAVRAEQHHHADERHGDEHHAALIEIRALAVEQEIEESRLDREQREEARAERAVKHRRRASVAATAAFLRLPEADART